MNEPFWMAPITFTCNGKGWHFFSLNAVDAFFSKKECMLKNERILKRKGFGFFSLLLRLEDFSLSHDI